MAKKHLFLHVAPDNITKTEVQNSGTTEKRYPLFKAFTIIVALLKKEKHRKV